LLALEYEGSCWMEGRGCMRRYSGWYPVLATVEGGTRKQRNDENKETRDLCQAHGLLDR
jgi:hypothetical protein